MVLRAQSCCPLVPSALFHVVPLRPPDLAKIAGIFQLSIQWLSAASAELEMGSDPKIWAGRDALGHPSMANREFGNCQLRQKKSKRHSRRVWSSGTATVLISMLLLANAQTLWAVRNTRTLCSHKKGGFFPIKKGDFHTDKVWHFCTAAKVCNFPSFPLQLPPFQMNSAGNPTPLPVFGGTCAYSKPQHCSVG